MSLILWNVQGCLSHKKGELHFISKLANDKGIVALNETFFNQTISDGEISYYFPNHSFIRTDRDTKQANAKKKQDGTLLLYPDDFMKCDELTFSKEFVEISRAVLKVDENDNGVAFTTTYMPQDTPLLKFKETVEVIETFMNSNPNSTHHLSGDINLSTDTGDKNLFPVILSGREDINTYLYQKRERAHIIFNLTNKRGLMQIVDKATRGKNILDIIFTNSRSRGIDVVGANELPDHNVIINHTDLTAPAIADKADDDSPEIKILDTREMNVNKCKIMLANTNWHQELRNMKTHEQTARYIPVLTEKMTKAGAMTSAPRGKAKPPRHLKRLLDQKKNKNLDLKFLSDRAKSEKSKHN